METIFHNEPRIEEWVNQITETLFAVCLLTGVDSEEEFLKGRLIVTKIASVLMSISVFPVQYLEDGLRQLLEQQLPDVRVIDNFPTFQETMNKMLKEGISKVQEESNLTEAECGVALPLVEGRVSRPDEKCVAEYDGEVVLEEHKVDIGEVVNEEVISSQVKELISAPKVFGEAEHLKNVLNFLYSNKNVTWNFELRGETFLAQAEDILIYLEEPQHPLNMQIYNNEGWKVVICNTEDLKFPRRLERRIRQFQRIGKKSYL